MKNFSRCLLALAVTLGAHAQAAQELADHQAGYVEILKGRAVTGTNRLYGEPTTNYGEPMGTVGFYNLGVFNPDGSEAGIIDHNTPEDAVIATSVDEGFLTMAGLPLSLIDPELNNIPLRKVAVNVSPDGEVRMPLPSTLSVDPLTANQVPMNNVTLKEWLSAEGRAKVRCIDDGSVNQKGSIKIRARHLIPNRLYTVWAIFETPDAQFAAVPLGGAPNVIATDKNGKGSFSRELGFCPFERTEAGGRLLAVDVVYHSDHQVYGQVPDLALKSLLTGTISHTQLEFTIAGESLLND